MLEKIKAFFRKKNTDTDDIAMAIKAKIAKLNGYRVESSEPVEEVQDPVADPEYLNKNCTDLDDFVISPEMNEYDLKKLCELNGINLQIAAGWYKILTDLLIELDEAGWNREVSCIKEKYASLKFYTDQKYDEITDKYEELSESICETCGKKGTIRYNTGWDHVACRAHYLEGKGAISVMDGGFVLNAATYSWKDVKDAVFEGLYNDDHHFLVLIFNGPFIEHAGWTDDRLYIAKGTSGFGSFLKSVPLNFKDLDYGYFNSYANVSACKICGYLAVYDQVCECCDGSVWKGEDVEYWKEDKFIAFYQSEWIADDGPKYAELDDRYPKDSSYKLITRPSVDEA